MLVTKISNQPSKKQFSNAALAQKQFSIVEVVVEMKSRKRILFLNQMGQEVNWTIQLERK